MKADFLVLGGDGMQGSIVSRFLLKKGYAVHSADIFDYRLQRMAKEFKKNFSHSKVDAGNTVELSALVRGTNPSVVINCAEGDINLIVYRVCLKAGKHVIDLGSDIPVTKEQFALSSAFRKKKLLGITGCGSTPGINNLMLQKLISKFDEIETIQAGFAWNANKKAFVAPFSMGSVLYELTQSATFFERGRFRSVEPLSTRKTRKFPKLGEQDIYLIDHPEVFTFYKFCKSKNKTPKNIYFYGSFPRHCLKTLLVLKDLGFNSQEEPVVINDREIYPTDFLTQMLKKIRIPKDYSESERLWVTVLGKVNGKRQVLEMSCAIKTLPRWAEAGSNIDTAFPAAIIAEMILDGRISARGSFSPEEIVEPDTLFHELNKYGMNFHTKVMPPGS